MVVVVVYPRNLPLKLVEIGSVTAEILLSLSLYDGGDGRWIKVIFVPYPIFESNLGIPESRELFPGLTTTTHTNSMSAISQLLLTRVQPNFKVRFLG